MIAGGKAKAYPIEQLPDGKVVNDIVGGQQLRVAFHKAERRPEVRDTSSAAVPAVMVFWFAWQAFYPGTEVWRR